MTKEELVAWAERHFGRGQQSLAAETLGLSLPGYRKQLYGKRHVSRQTARLAVAWEVMTPRQREEVRRRLAAEDSDRG